VRVCLCYYICLSQFLPVCLCVCVCAAFIIIIIIITCISISSLDPPSVDIPKRQKLSVYHAVVLFFGSPILGLPSFRPAYSYAHTCIYVPHPHTHRHSHPRPVVVSVSLFCSMRPPHHSPSSCVCLNLGV
jgi:hypothetical protein